MQEAEEEEEMPLEDLIIDSMDMESNADEESDEELSHTIPVESSGPHGSIALGSDTEGEDPDNGSDSDLSDFVVNDGFRNKLDSSSIITDNKIAPLRPFYQPVQLPLTQESDDELPDIAAIGSRSRKSSSPSHTNGNEVAGVRGKNRRSRQIIDDSDE